jgi:hypothetical protein
MPVLRIEHRVADYDGWKQAFDGDPVGREESGVRKYQILRSVEDPSLVMIDLEFDTWEEADGLLAAMGEVWKVAEPAGLVAGPQARIADVVETKTY